MMLDNAREHGVEAHEGVHVLDVLFEGDRAVGVTHQGRGRRAPRGPRQGRRRRQRPGGAAAEPLQAAPVGSGAEQGRDLDLLGGRLPRHRPRRRRDDGAADRRQERLVLVHPAARRHRQRRRRRAVRLPVQGPRRATSRPIRRRSSAARRSRSASRTRRASPATSRRRTTRTARRQVAGDGWVLVGDAFGFLDPLYSSGVLLALKSGELAADAIVEGWKGDVAAAQLGKWGAGVQRGRRSHAPAGLRVLRRLQLRQRSSRNYPELRGTVTDLLIGDLFTDRVDKVWGPMESLYPADKQRLMTWHEGVAPDAGATQGQRARAARGTTADSRLAPAIAAASSLPRPMPPAWSTSRCSSATWRKPSTRCGGAPAWTSSPNHEDH